MRRENAGLPERGGHELWLDVQVATVSSCFAACVCWEVRREGRQRIY